MYTESVANRRKSGAQHLVAFDVVITTLDVSP